MSTAAKNFNILATSLSVLYNYFDTVQQNYFSYLHPAKILDLLAKPFFPCALFQIDDSLIKLIDRILVQFVSVI